MWSPASRTRLLTAQCAKGTSPFMVNAPRRQTCADRHSGCLIRHPPCKNSTNTLPDPNRFETRDKIADRVRELRAREARPTGKCSRRKAMLSSNSARSYLRSNSLASAPAGRYQYQSPAATAQREEIDELNRTANGTAALGVAIVFRAIACEASHLRGIPPRGGVRAQRTTATDRTLPAVRRHEVRLRKNSEPSH